MMMEKREEEEVGSRGFINCKSFDSLFLCKCQQKHNQKQKLLKLICLRMY